MTAVPPDFEDLLTRPVFCDLATVRTDGDPTVTPMWFSWDGELVRFTHTTKREKLRNIAHNPHVAISIYDPDNPYRYLALRGSVESIEPDPTGAFYVTLAKRYGLTDPKPPDDAPDRVVIAVRPFSFAGR